MAAAALAKSDEKWLETVIFMSAGTFSRFREGAVRGIAVAKSSQRIGRFVWNPD